MTPQRKAHTKRRTSKKKTVVGWRKNLPQIRFGILALSVAVFALGSVSAQLWAYHNTQFPQVLRDAVMAIVAHQKAGGPVPVTADFNNSQFYNLEETWGITTNSKWLAYYSTRIVPYYLRERVGSGIYPDFIIVRPWLGDESFNLGGRAQCKYDGFKMRDVCIVWINSRYFDDPALMDGRDILEVFVHEMVHIQGGNFTFPERLEEGETWAGWSAILESKTSAATLEVLSAMCNYGDPLACKSFWYQLETLSSRSLRSHLKGDEWAYDLFADIFLRDGRGEQRARKSNRYWFSHEDERNQIIEKYYRSPYEDHLIAYLKYGMALDGGSPTYLGDGEYLLRSVPFDDAQDLLGFWAIWLRLLTH